MDDRYFGKVVRINSDYEIVINKGLLDGVEEDHEFTIVGVGESILDPDTGEDLGQLEIVRGNVRAMHVQPKMATLSTYEYEQSESKKEIRKVSPTARGSSLFLVGTKDTVTESITPGKRIRKNLKGVRIGDVAIRK